MNSVLNHDYSFLFALERELHNPACRHNPARLAELLAPDFFEFGASGRVWQRAETLAKLPEEGKSTPAPSITTDNYQALPLAAEVVLVTYRAEKPDNGAKTLRSSLWRHSANGWQMVFHQGTKILD